MPSVKERTKSTQAKSERKFIEMGLKGMSVQQSQAMLPTTNDEYSNEYQEQN